MPIIAGTFVGFVFGLALAAFGLGPALIVLPILGALLGLWVLIWGRDSADAPSRTPEQVEETLKKDRARWGMK